MFAIKVLFHGQPAQKPSERYWEYKDVNISNKQEVFSEQYTKNSIPISVRLKIFMGRFPRNVNCEAGDWVGSEDTIICIVSVHICPSWLECTDVLATSSFD